MIGREVWNELDEKLRVLIAVAALCVIGVVVVDVATGEDFPDALRHFVMAQIVLVIVLYTITVVVGVVTWHKRVFDTESLKEVGKARLARIAGCIIFLLEEAVSLAERFGDEHLVWRTPAIQIALILWLYAWGHIDTKRVLSLKEARA
jgi:hypothetical protein